MKMFLKKLSWAALLSKSIAHGFAQMDLLKYESFKDFVPVTHFTIPPQEKSGFHRRKANQPVFELRKGKFKINAF